MSNNNLEKNEVDQLNKIYEDFALRLGEIEKRRNEAVIDLSRRSNEKQAQEVLKSICKLR